MIVVELDLRALLEREEIAWELFEDAADASTAQEWAFRTRAYERWEEANDELERRRRLGDVVRSSGVGGVG